MIIRIFVQNIAYGGLRSGDGEYLDRWPLIVERFGALSHRPDIAVLLEGNDWDRYGHRQLVRAKRDLAMESLPLPQSSSGYVPVTLYDPRSLGTWQRWDAAYSRETVHGFGVAAFDIGLPDLLSVAGVHLNPFSPDRALQEIQFISNRAYRNGPLAIICGDLNYLPMGDELPDSSDLRPFNIAARTLPLADGRSGRGAADHRVAMSLSHAGFRDAAEIIGTDRALRPTTPGGIRIDQFWLSEPLWDTVVDVETFDTPMGASDHHAILLTIDTAKAQNAADWVYHG